MTPLRLHGTCPECGFIERLRPDGTMVQHARPRRTEHTAGLAERAGLTVTRETWRGEGT